MPKRALRAWIAASLALVGAVEAGASARVARELVFAVFLDDQPIGTQRFALERSGDALRVETRATFSLEWLRIPLYAYDHDNVEHWRAGCLQSIRSRTNANGTPYAVSGVAEADGFRVRSNDGERRLDACVRTFAYWDKAQLLGRDRLLNSQTGEYVPVSVRSLGAGRERIAGRDVAVERFAIEGKDLAITLGYEAGSGEWLTLSSRVAGGRTLAYRRTDLPSAPAPDAPAR